MRGNTMRLIITSRHPTRNRVIGPAPSIYTEPTVTGFD
jgi:hypothetical protein